MTRAEIPSLVVGFVNKGGSGQLRFLSAFTVRAPSECGSERCRYMTLKWGIEGSHLKAFSASRRSPFLFPKLQLPWFPTVWAHIWEAVYWRSGFLDQLLEHNSCRFVLSGSERVDRTRQGDLPGDMEPDFLFPKARCWGECGLQAHKALAKDRRGSHTAFSATAFGICISRAF